MAQYQRWVINKRPVAGEAFALGPEGTFRLEQGEVRAEALEEEQVLVQVHYLSNDPAQKFWIASVDAAYARSPREGETVPARGLGQVVASRSARFRAGAWVTARTGWSTLAVLRAGEADNELVEVRPLEHMWWHLAVLGGTSKTAYFIFARYLGLRETAGGGGGGSGGSGTLLLSGAAGAVGSVCVQLALNVFGFDKVVAIAGGPEKLAFVESLAPAGKVVGVDYKSPDFAARLRAAAPARGIDAFIDNVGGSILDQGVLLLRPNATVVACGAISAYSDRSKFAFNSYYAVITKRLTIMGVLLGDNRDRFQEAEDALLRYARAGLLRTDEQSTATIVDAIGDDFANVPAIWDRLFHGGNRGKLITRVHA